MTMRGMAVVGVLAVGIAGCAHLPVGPPAAPEVPVTRPLKPPTRAATPAAPTAAPPAVASHPGVPPLDLGLLRQRLRETKAIGVFTKLSLKNQVDDLLERFRDFYGKKNTETVPDLRQRYDLLLLKVLAVLQDGDPALASTIAASREAIWGILADPVKFSKL
jgi:hypothetical protein